jgi:thiamine-phosphate pyrophosphorylase
MMLCLITDRRQRSPVEQAGEAIDAGIHLIQVRERDLDTASLAAMVERIVAMTRSSSTRVVVNDRVDVALTTGADGVHLRGDSLPAARVRAMAPPGFLIGRSVHGPGEAADTARHVDYLIAGTVFPTTSKPGMHDFLGLTGLAAVAGAVPVPVFGVGGMSIERAGEVAAAGAGGLAAISLFAGVERPIKEVVRQLRERININGGFFSQR